jgi:hypothetical protein
MARAPAWAPGPRSEQGCGHPAWGSRTAVAFLVGLLLLAT